jgi:hypothetical protein
MENPEPDTLISENTDVDTKKEIIFDDENPKVNLDEMNQRLNHEEVNEEVNEDPLESIEKLSEHFAELIENMKNAQQKLSEITQVKLSKDEFIEKLSKCQNFRSQMFSENRIYNTIKNFLNFDALYAEYEEMKTEKVAVLSQYVQGKFLYISEKIGERVRISYREYDYEILGFHNFPMSDPGAVLPLDDEELKYWKMSGINGHYIFQKNEEEVLQPISYMRVYGIKKDVFLYGGEIIVHVQDAEIEFSSEKEEKLLNNMLDYLGTIGGDNIEKIMDRIIRENPGINLPDDTPE